MFGPTTAAAAQDTIDRKRAALADAAVEGRVRDLAHLVNEIATAEGVWLVLATDEKMVSNGLEADERMEVITDLLLRGADDQWSGRGNDANRAHYDGVRDAASNLLRRLRTQK